MQPYYDVPLPDSVPEYVWRMKPGRDESSRRHVPVILHPSLEKALSAAKAKVRGSPGLSLGRCGSRDGFTVYDSAGKPLEQHLLKEEIFEKN